MKRHRVGRGRTHRYLPHRDFNAGDYQFRTSHTRGRRWHVWHRGDYVGQILESRKGYKTERSASGMGDLLDDALNSLIGHKHETVYARAT